MWTPLRQPRHLFLYPGCSCCGVTGCSFCAAAPAQWRLSVSGLSDSACTNCEAWNGDWTLTNNPLIPLPGGACRWSTPRDDGPTPCSGGCSGCSRWQLELTSSSANLLADGGGIAVYSLPMEDFDCLGTNVLTKGSATLACNGWPATLTIEPA